MAQFNNVSVKKKANIYFDGKCVSHTVLSPNGTRNTLGVIFPSTLKFNTESPELMEIISLLGKVAGKHMRREISLLCQATQVS